MNPISPPSQWLKNAGQLITGKVAVPDGSPQPSLILPTGGLNDYIIPNVIPFIINLLFFLVIISSLIFLIIGGIMWITSGGNKEGMAKARSTITFAVIGLVLGLASWIIIGIISCYFNIYLGMTLNCGGRTYFGI